MPQGAGAGDTGRPRLPLELRLAPPRHGTLRLHPLHPPHQLYGTHTSKHGSVTHCGKARCSLQRTHRSRRRIPRCCSRSSCCCCWRSCRCCSSCSCRFCTTRAPRLLSLRMQLLLLPRVRQARESSRCRSSRRLAPGSACLGQQTPARKVHTNRDRDRPSRRAWAAGEGAGSGAWSRPPPQRPWGAPPEAGLQARQLQTHPQS